jgi:hypothetical protein
VAEANRWIAAAQQLDGWMRERDYAGYDPHDWLSARPIRALSFGSRWLGAAWTQVGKRVPVQLRPLVGVSPARNAKGIGLTLAAHARLFSATGTVSYTASASGFIEWLGASGVRAGDGIGWGYPFPWANRDFYAPHGTPSSVVTSFIGQALLDSTEYAPGHVPTEEARRLAAGAGAFIATGLRRIPGPDGTFCFSYTPLDRRAVHNASLLAAALLARLAAAGSARADEWAADALAAARFTVRSQLPDGSWPYGAGARNAWVDSFHTSYCLFSLDAIARALRTTEFDDAIADGIRYWRGAFFGGPGVGFHPGVAFPVDTHAVAHAIFTFCELQHRIPDALAEAERLADWCMREMRDPAGFFYYQKHRHYVNRLPYMRWTQAWMLLALAQLAASTPAAVPATRPVMIRQ